MPEDDILKQLRTEEVLKDLAGKYHKVPELARKEPVSGGEAAIEQILKNQAEQAARLDKYPFLQETFSKEILKQIFDLEKQALDIIAKFYGQTGSSTNIEPRVDIQDPSHLEKARECLNEIERLLDAGKIWQHKFSTMSGSGTGDALEVSDKDSIYWITEQGMSFRLRRVSLYDEGHLRQAVQGIMEKIWYESPDQNFMKSEQPSMGLRVKEVVSKKIISLEKDYLVGQDQNIVNFTSVIRLHKDGDKLIGLSTDGSSEVEVHTGDMINHIYF